MRPPLRARAIDRLLRSWSTPAPDPLARALQPLAWLHLVLWRLRRMAYRCGWLRSGAAPVPVLVVGNWVAGGAGKTPTVMMLLPRLRALGFHPGVVSRGHGRPGPDALREVLRSSPADDVGDEPLLIHLRTGAPVVVARDRLAAAQALCRAHPEVDLIVTDDGLQHWRLMRDAQLVVVDERGAGNGLLLPAGPLREPLPSRLPPATLVLYSAGQQTTALPGHSGRRRLAHIVPLDQWWPSAARIDSPMPGPTTGPVIDPALHGRRLLAVAGLAKPEGFFQMLEAAGLRIERLALPDHARFDPLPWPADTSDVVLTEKDAVKLPRGRTGATRVWVATLDFQPDAGFDAALRELCERFLRRPPRPAPLD
jgi:tetraacyldisaccharide 4'-kinase